MSVVYTCECGTYNFYIVDSPLTTEVTPLNFLETALVDELESNQIFYRRKFQGTLLFGGRGNKADFDYFRAIEQATPCKRLTFLIYKESVLLWEGYFSTSKGDWDLDACTFEVTPIVTDHYVDLLDEGDIQYNILLDGEIPEVTSIYDNGVVVQTDYTHCRMLIDVIEYLVAKIAPTAVVDSTFFEEAINPVTLTTNRYNYLTIAQKSDIKRPASTNPATIGMMSFNEVMNICRIMNLYWDYDGTTLRIEHVSFWPQTAGLDIRTQKITRGTNKYKYLSESMPKYELFSWMEAGSSDFLGKSIWYDSVCVNQDPASNSTEYRFSNITTDLAYIQLCVLDPETSSKISDDGWVLLANENRGGSLYIWSNIAFLAIGAEPAIQFNVDLAWSWLHRCFWKHDRQLIEGYMNSALTDFYTSRKVKQQDCSIVTCVDFDPTEYITTELGETYFGSEKGKVGKAIIRPYGQIDLNLLYGPVDNVNPGITYDKFIFIQEEMTDNTWVYGSTFYGLLSEPAPVGNLVLTFDFIVFDGIAGNCTVTPVTITFLAGNYKADSGEIPWCDPGGGAPYCMNSIINEVYPAGWTFLYLLNSQCV